MAGETVAGLAAQKRLGEDFLRELGLADVPGGGVTIPYLDAEGCEVFHRRRGVPSRPRFEQPKGAALAPYGLWRMPSPDGAPEMALCEGETDTITLWSIGVEALGLPGAQSVGCLNREHISAARTLWLPLDADEAGRKFRDGILARLAQLGLRPRVYAVEMPPGFKDITDVRAADPDGFPSRWRQMCRAAGQLFVPTPPPTLGQYARNGHAGNGVSSVSSTVCRVSKSPPPRILREYKDLPLAALPRPLARLAGEAATAMGCDPAYIALPALAVCAAAIGNSRAIQLKSGWSEPCVIWTAIVGESGTLKTPAYKLAMAPMYAAQRRMRDEHRIQMARWSSQVEEARERKRGGGDAELPTKPPMGRAWVGDVTIEKLAEILEDNPRGVLVARDELDGWFKSLTKYKSSGGGSDLPNYLELHGAGTLSNDRKTGERRFIYVERAAASITGGIQPGVLCRALTGEHFEAGLAARLLMAWPDRRKKKWTDAEVSGEVLADYHRLVEGLLSLPMQSGGPGAEATPYWLGLDGGAKHAWVRFYDQWAGVQAAAEGDLAAAYSKLEGAAARLALLHHVATMIDLECDTLRPVTSVSIEAGAELARWFASEAERIYASVSETDEERSCRRLLGWLKAQGGVSTVKDLQRANYRTWPTSESARSALDALAAAGLGSWRDRPSGPRGGRPTEEFVLDQAALDDLITQQTVDETDQTPLGAVDQDAETWCGGVDDTPFD